MSSSIASFTETATLSQRRLADPSKPVPKPKQKVIVTGGSGKLGQWVVKEMVEHGWEVHNLDIMPPPPAQAALGARFTKVDLADYGQVVASLTECDDRYRGIDAVIHLAAIPSTGMAPNHVIFHNNINGTYNILEACRVLRIRNVALASSETVFGIPLHPHPVAKLPITEEVERPESSYSLSKLLGEKMAEQFTRWDPTAKIVNIRLSNVMTPEQYSNFKNFDPWGRAWNGFCYIDARDCAQAFRKALETPLTGSHVFNIANADTCFTQPTKELAEMVFPGIEYTPDTSDPREGLISIRKAREMLGYEPEYDWQSEVKKLEGK